MVSGRRTNDQVIERFVLTWRLVSSRARVIGDDDERPSLEGSHGLPLGVCSYHSSHLTSPCLTFISTDLVSSEPSECDPVRRGSEQSCPTGRFTAHSLPLGADEMKSVEMRSDEMR